MNLDRAGNLRDRLTVVPRELWPSGFDPEPYEVWLSRKFMVQAYREGAGVIRLSVCRTQQAKNGQWREGISWEELQAIKRETGLGGCMALEIFPRDRDVVNVANMRHLWVVPEPIRSIGWYGADPQPEVPAVAAKGGMKAFVAGLCLSAVLALAGSGFAAGYFLHPSPASPVRAAVLVACGDPRWAVLEDQQRLYIVSWREIREQPTLTAWFEHAVITRRSVGCGGGL